MTAPSTSRPRRRLLRRAVLVVLALVALVSAGAATYFAIPQRDLPEAAAALTSTETVAFTREGDDLVLAPRAGPAATGLILYPGGKVDQAAYAPTAASIAAKGYLVAIVSMPLNLAVLGIDRADRVLRSHPEIETWAIGGHSLGGAMGAQYVAGHPGTIDGLVLWASYSAVQIPLDTDRPVRALIVYGSLDAGAASYTSPVNLGRLPTDPTIVRIEGGNHEQMGWYTGQPNDPPATISREDQQRRLIEATVAFLATLRAR